MSNYAINLLAAATLLAVACQNPSPTSSNTEAEQAKKMFVAYYGTPVLDGSGADDIWTQGEWMPLDQIWLGTPPSKDDFEGRFKLAWDENNLYLLAEITDDSLIDIHPEGLKQYWDDDCLEVFLDEDASGGDHQYNYNAFAYHIALDGKVVDIAPDSSFRFYDDHCLTRRLTRDHTSTWEIAIRVFDGNQYSDGGENIPKLLSSGKKMGFALAYCDNDTSQERENFIGSVPIPGEDKNRGWIDADVFGLLELK